MGMTVCKEMKKLRKYLDDNKIEWWDDSSISAMFWMVRTKFHYKGREFSVINGVGSYGGCVTVDCKNNGLLECMIDGREPIGHLTAKEVIEKIER